MGKDGPDNLDTPQLLDPLDADGKVVPKRPFAAPTLPTTREVLAVMRDKDIPSGAGKYVATIQPRKPFIPNELPSPTEQGRVLFEAFDATAAFDSFEALGVDDNDEPTSPSIVPDLEREE